MGHSGPPGLGQYYSSGTVLPVRHDFADCSDRKDMAWTKNEWDNDDYILFCLFSYQCFNEKKRKTLSVSGTVTFLFFQVRHFFVFMVIVMMFFYSSKERHKISIQREKNSNNVN